MKLLVLLGAVILFPFLLECQQSKAQAVIYGGNGSSEFGGPAFNNSGNVKVDATTECPTPSFNLIGFGRNADNWGSLNSFSEPNIRASGSSGFGNYGIAAGINVPFNSVALKACNEMVKTSARRSRLRSETEILVHCENFWKYDITSTQDFPEASKCLGLKPKEERPNPELAQLEKCFKYQQEGLDFRKLNKETLQAFPSLKPCMSLHFTPPTQRIITEREELSKTPSEKTTPDGIPIRIQINQ